MDSSSRKRKTIEAGGNGGVAEAQYSGARTSVWWNMDSCPLPQEGECRLIVRNIRSALARKNYCGPITFSVYGEFTTVPEEALRALYANGIRLIFTCAGYAAEKMLFGMMDWVERNPAPANLLLISGDESQLDIFRDLGKLKYNILLGHPDGASDKFLATASCAWHFSDLVEGSQECRPLLGTETSSALIALGSSDSFKGRGSPPYSTAITSVWWDLEACPVPSDCDFNTIPINIRAALTRKNYCGPITIFIYTTRIPTNAQPADDIRFVTVSASRKMLYDMIIWAKKNPAPANYLLILGDADYSVSLQKLRCQNFNVLLAQPDGASADLVDAASFVWPWTSLVYGDRRSRSGSSKLMPGEDNSDPKHDI